MHCHHQLLESDVNRHERWRALQLVLHHHIWQVAKCYAETCFQKFVIDNLQRLKGLREPELLTESKELKINLRQGFVSTGTDDLQHTVLTADKAKKILCEMISRRLRLKSVPATYDIGKRWFSYEDLSLPHCS